MPLGRGVAATVWFSSSAASCASRHCRKPSAAVFMIRLAARGASLESAMLVAATTPRGFTGHEGPEDAGLAHMNGRVCDPALGRCLSADPFVLRLTTSRAEPQPRRLRVQQRARRARGKPRRSRHHHRARSPPPISRWRWTGTSPQGGTAQASSGAGRRIPFALVWAVQAGADACPPRGREPECPGSRHAPERPKRVPRRTWRPACGRGCQRRAGLAWATGARGRRDWERGRRRRSMMRCFIEDRAGRSWHSDRMAPCAT